MKRLIYMAAVLMLASCGQEIRKASETPVVKVSVQTVHSTQNHTDRTYLGSLKASRSAAVSYSHSGILERVNVRQGDRVKQGDILAVISSQNVRSSYEVSKASFEQAKDGLARVEKVHASGSIPEVKYVEVRTQYEQAKAAFDAASKSLEDCNIRAPFDGVVGDVSDEAGVQVEPFTRFCLIVDDRSMEAQIFVPESEIGSIRTGDHALVSIPALEMEDLSAVVETKGILGSALSHTYACKLKMVDGAGKIMDGMACKVTFSSRGVDNVVIPAKAVLTDDVGRYVWTVEDGIVRRRYVMVSGYSGRGVIVSGGVEAGMKVIVEGSRKVSTGMTVEYAEVGDDQ